MYIAEFHGPNYVNQKKESGGLGNGKVEDTNLTLLFKLGWSMATYLDKVWVQILQIKIFEMQTLS